MSNKKIVKKLYESAIVKRKNRFDIWEERKAYGDSVTPSTYSKKYCNKVVNKIYDSLKNTSKRILSIGCGNAFIEQGLLNKGCDVLATDISDYALKLAKKKGLRTLELDATKKDWQLPDKSFDLVLFEGVVGHLIKKGSFHNSINEARRVLDTDGKIIVINDVPKNTSLKIQKHNDKTINFYWVSKDQIKDTIMESGFSRINADCIEYKRPQSGINKRAFVIGTKEETVLLINTPQIKELVYPQAKISDKYLTQPYELALLDSYLSKKGLKTILIDANANFSTFNEFRKYLKTACAKPDYIVYNTIYFDRYWVLPLSIDNAISTGRILRQVFPKSKIISVGPHNTQFPKITKKELIADDYIGSDFWKVIDVICKENMTKDKILKCVPKYDKIDNEKYSDRVLGKNFFLLTTSLGCPFRCKFCTKPFGEPAYAPIETIRETLESIKNISKNKRFNILFHDDNFTTNINHLKKVLKLLKEFNVKWRCLSRVDTITKKTLKEMKDAGCIGISYGLEALNQNTLDKYHKQISTKQIKEICKYSNSLGIVSENFLIVGNPGETESDLKILSAKIKELGLQQISLFFPIPYPKTSIAKEIKIRQDFKEIADIAGTVGNNFNQKQLKKTIDSFEDSLFYHEKHSKENICAFGIDLKITPDNKVYLIEINGARVGVLPMRLLTKTNVYEKMLDSIRKDFKYPIEIYGTHHGEKITDRIKSKDIKEGLRKKYCVKKGSELIFRHKSERKIIWNLYKDCYRFDEERFIVINPYNIEKLTYNKNLAHKVLKGSPIYPITYNNEELSKKDVIAMKHKYLILKVPHIEHGKGIHILKSDKKIDGKYLFEKDDIFDYCKKHRIRRFLIQEFIPNKLIEYSKDRKSEACMRYVVLIKEKDGKVSIETYGGFWRLAKSSWDSKEAIEGRLIANYDKSKIAKMISKEEDKIAAKAVKKYFPDIYQKMKEVSFD